MYNIVFIRENDSIHLTQSNIARVDESENYIEKIEKISSEDLDGIKEIKIYNYQTDNIYKFIEDKGYELKLSKLEEELKETQNQLNYYKSLCEL